jgi:hypothetical protein
MKGTEKRKIINSLIMNNPKEWRGYYSLSREEGEGGIFGDSIEVQALFEPNGCKTSKMGEG